MHTTARWKLNLALSLKMGQLIKDAVVSCHGDVVYVYIVRHSELIENELRKIV